MSSSGTMRVSAPPVSERPVWDSQVKLEGSKSISNRALILQALCPEANALEDHRLPGNLSPSEDTRTLLRLLRSNEKTLDAGAAGTTYRFLSAWLARQPGERILTGSARMLQRPIGILVDALRELGANISYTGEEGYPPLHITGSELRGGRVRIPADVSSQYISALLLIGPTLAEGLELELLGKIGSRPYIALTLRMMEHYGASVRWEGMIIRVEPRLYQWQAFSVEGDWSAASYYYSAIALCPVGARLRIAGLFEESHQGDAVVAALYAHLGVKTTYLDGGVQLERIPHRVPVLTADFSDCPDLAQTAVVTCAALGVPARFSGLESLRIKETDRTAALREQLQPYGVDFRELVPGTWQLDGQLVTAATGIPRIHTYDDHRMAMAFAPLALHWPEIVIEDPQVVRKSYPGFWRDWESLGFTLKVEGDSA